MSQTTKVPLQEHVRIIQSLGENGCRRHIWSVLLAYTWRSSLPSFMHLPGMECHMYSMQTCMCRDPFLAGHMTVEAFKLSYEAMLYPIPNHDKPNVYL